MSQMIEEIKMVLRKKAVIFETGGIKPTCELGESWIGKVAWQNPGETLPMGQNNKPMVPIATMFVEESNYIPEALQGIKLITVFMDFEFWNNLGAGDYKDFFEIRTYTSLDNLEKCDYTSEEILPFPLVAKKVENEFPQWEDLGDSNEPLFDIILKLEKDEGVDYYTDIFEENNSCHKFGGYPSTIQGGMCFDDGYEFVMQISSDEKADMNIVDGGNFYFAYNKETKTWRVGCDFY